MGVEPVVKLDGLTVRYGKLTAVDDLSLEVPKGKVFALLGRNGSGKSSTVRCVLGQQRPTAGRSRILGFDSWKGRRRAMERVGVVPENPDVPPDSTADRVEKFMARVTPFWRSAHYFDRLESFGVPRKQRFARLSKGQQRQLALALALAGSPRLLVLDDPTLGLDAVARRKLYEELIAELADRGTTVFLTTHDLAGVEAIADQVGVIQGGSLLVDEKLDVLKARYCRLIWTPTDEVPRERIEAGLQHLGPVGGGLATGATEAVVEDFSEFGFDRFRQEAPVEVMRVDSLSLEEIFIALCGAEPGRSIMNATLAVMTREVMARRELLLMAVAVAIMISFLPFLPNIENYEATDVRTVGSSASALALGCVLALVLGATMVGSELSEGRLGFFFSRPVSGLAVWWGKVLAGMALIWIVEIIVLAPALYAEGVGIFTSSDPFDWLTILGYVLAPLLLFLLAHAVSIMARARTPWLILDMSGAIVVAIIGWLILKPFLELGAPIALLVISGCLIAALLIAFSVGGASGVAVGRVDLKRAHSALSLALWGTLGICIAGVTTYGNWLRNFGPNEFSNVDVVTVAPDGGWIEAVGRAKGRLDIERRYLVSSTAEHWLPLPSPGPSFYRTIFSLDGSTAVWRGGGPAGEPRSLWWADLGRPDPMARSTNLLVSHGAALTLSRDGTRLAILEEGTVSVYELGEERLVKAVRLPEGLQRAAGVFIDPESIRLYARIDVDGAQSILIAQIDVATGQLVRTGVLPGVEEISWFAVDAALRHMFVSSRSVVDLVSTRALYDAVDGSFIRYVDPAGFPQFLQDGRILLASESDDGSVTLVAEQIDGEGRIVHTIGGALGSRVNGEAVANGVVVSHLVDPSDRTQGIRLTLFDVDTGETRNIGSHLRSTARRFPWQAGVSMGFFWHRNQPAVSRLFIDQTGALVRWDPESGEMVRIVGGRQ